jgi:hypothetical protein
MPIKNNKTAPIMENPDVQELLGILKAHSAKSTPDFMAVLNHVVAMEKQLAAAVTELAAMRRDLAEAERRNHPIKNVLQKAVVSMQAQVLELRERLAEAKQAVIDGCKNAVAAFKEKGITALDNTARFFKVKPILEAIHTSADKSAHDADKIVSNIELASKLYHEAGRHLKNTIRALTGKEAIQEAKPPGKVAKALSAPYRAARTCFKGIRNNAVAAVGKLGRLEDRAKPSFEQTMKECTEKVKQAERERKTPERATPANEER